MFLPQCWFMAGCVNQVFFLSRPSSILYLYIFPHTLYAAFCKLLWIRVLTKCNVKTNVCDRFLFWFWFFSVSRDIVLSSRFFSPPSSCHDSFASVLVGGLVVLIMFFFFPPHPRSILHPPSSISTSPVPSGAGSLKIDFVGELNDKMKGFYRSKYASQSGEVRYAAVTQFEVNNYYEMYNKQTRISAAS